ncbi:MAG TPA: hypothetical protein VG759_22160 [Candidatus Angelobacter sp.]|nr:hypothetical protein [Candidatus Angelobacter sp.]
MRVKLKSSFICSAALFILFGASVLSQATCTFQNVAASRDSSGRTITVIPSISECDSLSTRINLQVFSLGSNPFWTTQVTYTSGPTNILVNGASTRLGSVVAKTGFSFQAQVALGFLTYGDYNFTTSASGGPSTQPQSFTIRISPFQLQPAQLFIATGGTRPDLSVFSVPTNLSGNLTFNRTMVSNDKGKLPTDISFAQSGLSAKVTALTQGGSGVFSVTAKKSIFTSSGQVIVPPQPLIQILIGEAQGQSDVVKTAVASVIRNRTISRRNFLEDKKNYTDEVFARKQFASTSTSRFIHAQSRQGADSSSEYDAALIDAGRVFLGTGALNLSGAIGFGSPGAVAGGSLEVKKVKDALARCPKISASDKQLNFSGLWFPTVDYDSQIVIFNSIDAGVMVFIRERPSKNDCAVIALGLN